MISSHLHSNRPAQRGRLIFLVLTAALLGTWPNLLRAQLAPEIGYVFPPGAQAGTTMNVRLGGYDWTPDMQIFVHDPRIKLEIIGPPTEVLVPDPPYWFGAKARGPAWPLPREFPARLTIPADVPAGLVRWQVANANGASPAGVIQVGSAPEVDEEPRRTAPQSLPALPVTVNGQIRTIEEVDRYQFSVPKSGPVTIQLFARRLGSPLHAMLQVTDAEGQIVVDAADTEGRDLAVTFAALAMRNYVLTIHDLDYAGDRSYIYRLQLTPGPQALAAFPAAGRRGETRPVDFVGFGLATGAAQLERVTREVTFPAAPSEMTFAYQVETLFGSASPISLGLSNGTEFVDGSVSQEIPCLEVPGAITGALDVPAGVDRYQVRLRKDEDWKISAQSRTAAMPLDLDLTVIGPDGKALATNDDAAPGTTDASLLFKVPDDGTYRLLVTDRAGHGGTAAACYRLVVERPVGDYSLNIPSQLAMPLGGQGKLTIQATRIGEFKGSIQVTLDGLPEGVGAPADLVIPPEKNDLAIDLVCAPDAPASAALCRVSSTASIGEGTSTRFNGSVLLATVMKPRCKITPEGLDDVRKIQRGSTFPAPLLIERLEGYAGEIVLEMTSKQQRHRQGLASGEFTVPPDARRVEYPIFVPEWMETTKTSRMILNGVVRVPDPKGNLRTLVQRMEMRIGILPEGALMKLGHSAGEPSVIAGEEIQVPLTVARTPEFRELVRIELAPAEFVPDWISCDPLTLAADRTEGTLKIRLARDTRLCGARNIVIRATALKEGRWPVVSESTLVVRVSSPR